MDKLAINWQNLAQVWDSNSSLLLITVIRPFLWLW